MINLSFRVPVHNSGKKSSWYYMLNQNYKSEIEYLFKKIKIISIKWFLWSLIQRINERLLRAQTRFKCVCYATISLSFLSIFWNFFVKVLFLKWYKINSPQAFGCLPSTAKLGHKNLHSQITTEKQHFME